jgi:hypothetical protein
MRWLGLTCAMTLAAACGGEPVGSHVPRPNPAHVAGVAAAAATALTVADPDAARKNPEKPDQPERRPVAVDESVPADVLDRADAPPPADEPGRCEGPAKAGLELLPGAVDARDADARRCKPAPEPRDD